MLRVGYIGLGLMGKSIARNILKAGFPVVVHNRSRAAVDELVSEGAVAAKWTSSLPIYLIHQTWKKLRSAKTGSSKARVRG